MGNTFSFSRRRPRAGLGPNYSPSWLHDHSYSTLQSVLDNEQTKEERQKQLDTFEEDLLDFLEQETYFDTLVTLQLISLNDLSNPENRKTLDAHLDEKWKNINKFILLYAAFRINDDEIKKRLRKEFEQQITAIKPAYDCGEHVIDRSWFADALKGTDYLPIECRNFIVDIFLTVKVNETAVSSQTVSEKKKQFPPIFEQLTALFDSKPTEDQIAQFMKENPLPETETKILNIFFKASLMDIQGSPELELLLKTPKMEIDEIFFLYILHKFMYCSLESEGMEHQLAEYFSSHFTYNVPESSFGCFINRAYIVENRRIIEQLPKSCQEFIFRVLLVSQTSTNEGDETNYTMNTVVPPAFILNNDTTQKVRSEWNKNWNYYLYH